MSATISLKHSMKRSTNAAINLIQHALIITGLILIIGFLNAFSGDSLASDMQSSMDKSADTVDLSIIEEELDAAATSEAESSDILSPHMLGALDYVTQRYRVSPDALIPVFETAQLIGQERQIDPLLIVAIIGIESRFNPFAESTMGAQGLMQVIPRFHKDKLPKNKGAKPLLDPVTNIRVGVRVLEDAIRRSGSLVAGLQSYAGSSDPHGKYSSKVLAEKARLEEAGRQNNKPNA